MRRFLLKVNGEIHCPNGVCRPDSAAQWEGGEVLIPTSDPVHIASDGTNSSEPIQEGDELWVWTHEHEKFGRGWGLTAKARAGVQRTLDGFIAITLTQVERVSRPFGYRDLGEGPTQSGLLNHVKGLRHHKAYLIDDVEYADFSEIVRQRGSPLPDEVRFSGETDWAREIREHKDQILKDLSERRLNWQKARPAQAKFRENLFDVYEGRCALSQCTVPQALEAAHVLPHNGNSLRDRSDNGILLRRDLHSMFDAMLWSIDPDSGKVRFSKNVSDRSYSAFEGKVINHHVAREPLLVHFKQFLKASKDV